MSRVALRLAARVPILPPAVAATGGKAAERAGAKRVMATRPRRLRASGSDHRGSPATGAPAHGCSSA